MSYTLEDWILTSMHLHNLGEAYDFFVAPTLQSVRKTKPEFNVIVHQLLNEECQKHTGDSGTALFIKGKKPWHKVSRSRLPNQANTDRKKKHCTRCILA
jgi:hypothetical protein